MTAPTQIRGESLWVDVGEELGFVTFPKDVDLADGRFVEPGFDQGPDGREEVGGLLRVTVSMERGGTGELGKRELGEDIGEL